MQSYCFLRNTDAQLAGNLTGNEMEASASGLQSDFYLIPHNLLFFFLFFFDRVVINNSFFVGGLEFEDDRT